MQPNRSVSVPSGPPYTNGKPPSRTDLLARALAGEILAGRHPVGAMLPSESELVDDHGASLATVRGALRVLGTLGLTQRARGGIAQVVSAEVRAIYEIATGDGTEGGGYLAPTRVGLDRQRRAVADAELAVLLDARENSDWLHVTGLRLPVDPSFGPLAWFDAWLGGGVKQVPAGFDFSPEALEELCGTQVADVREELSAAPLTPAQARRLHARGGGFALQIMRRYLRGNGSLVAAVLDVHPASRVVVHARTRREG
jgi:GntR family transcriptional regulator